MTWFSSFASVLLIGVGIGEILVDHPAKGGGVLGAAAVFALLAIAFAIKERR